MKTFAHLSTVAAVTLAGLSFAPAAHAEPYPHSVDTQCTAVVKRSPVAAGVAPVFRYRWVTVGTAAPTGKVKIRVIRRKTGDVVQRSSRAYTGERTSYSVRPIQKRGRYDVVFVARGGAESVFENCTTRATFRVKR